jgi:hypothetical protein
MVRNILTALTVFTALFVAVVATWPSSFRVARTAEIPAPPDVAAALVNELRLVGPGGAEKTSTFAFAATPAGTRVTWTIGGQRGFFEKAAYLFLEADAPGGSFEGGFALLRAAARRAVRGN